VTSASMEKQTSNENKRMRMGFILIVVILLPGKLQIN